MFRKGFLALLGLALVSFLGCAGLLAQGTPQTAAPAQTPATHHVHHAMHHHAHANPMAKYQVGIHNLSGTLTTVDSSHHLVVVKDSDGVPFDFMVTRGTRIEVNGKRDTLDSLSDSTNQQVTVRFRDELQRGLRAVNVTVGG
jgi:hypothetical protein